MDSYTGEVPDGNPGPARNASEVYVIQGKKQAVRRCLSSRQQGKEPAGFAYWGSCA